MDSQIEIKRETEFYQGFIRLKMSVSNKAPSVITDATLDFLYEDDLLRIDRYEPPYEVRNGKVLLGNISGGTSKSIAVYFDPLMCTKSAEINCHVTYRDALGNVGFVPMEKKLISVVCPIIKTDLDINVGRLKEFIEKLPSKDSKIYEIQQGFDISKLASIAREVVEKHDVRHVRTLKTKDGREWEIWYYGKTKVTRADIVIKVSISSEKHYIELFAATETAEALTGLLADFGRDLKRSIEFRASGKGNVINVTIRDSVIQRSNLLDLCSMDGTCPVNILVEDSIIQRSTLISESDETRKFRQIFDNNPDEASIYAEERLSNRYSLSSIRIFTNSFRMIYDLNSYCQSSYIEREELLNKLYLLRSNFENVPEIANKRIIPLLDNGIKILSTLDSANMNDFKSRYLRLCNDLVELLHLEVVSSNEPYEGMSKEKEILRRQQEEAKKLEEIKRKAQEEADRKKKEQKIHQQEELRRLREEAERKQREEAERKKKEKEAQERKQRKEKEQKLREEEEKDRREREEQEKLKNQREETERKSREELEIKKFDEATKVQAAQQTAQSPVQQKVPPKKPPSSFSSAKPKSSSGKGILLFSLILGVLLMGAAVSYFGLNGDSDEVGAITGSASNEPSQSSDTYTNSIGMEFVKIPAGEFKMGSLSGEKDRDDDEGPVHKVTIEEAFYLGKFEVTQEQWREVMGDNPSYFEGDDRPVEVVSWNDVQEFIEKLNEMEGTNKYRLPSEAEWEYACRAGTTTRYYFGDDESELGDYAWYADNSKSFFVMKTHPVGQKKPNPWGLYDMHGNVYEWVQDRYHSDYDGAPSDGRAWESGSSSYRVRRGGCWHYDARYCRSADRYYCDPDIRYYDIGFRVLRKL